MSNIITITGYSTTIDATGGPQIINEDAFSKIQTVKINKEQVIYTKIMTSERVPNNMQLVVVDKGFGYFVDKSIDFSYSGSGDTGSGSTYTGVAEIDVGNISVGDSFINASMTEMWDALIKQEQFPVLTPPSSTFVSSITGYREVGDTITITFDSTFNRGGINPQYTSASPYRSGLPNTYEFTGVGLTNKSSTSLSDSEILSNYVVAINGQSWEGRVDYDAGVQPKSSYGNNYNSPLPAGSTNYITRSIIGVYPYFGTTVGITTQTKQVLKGFHDLYYELNMVAESGSGKQTAWFSSSHDPITGIQFFNTVSNQWEWIGGNQTNSLTTFDVTTTTIQVQGNAINYNVYTNNSPLVGARNLRFYTT